MNFLLLVVHFINIVQRCQESVMNQLKQIMVFHLVSMILINFVVVVWNVKLIHMFTQQLSSMNLCFVKYLMNLTQDHCLMMCMYLYSGLSTNPIFIVVIFLTIILQYLIVTYGGDFTRTSPLNSSQWLQTNNWIWINCSSCW